MFKYSRLPGSVRSFCSVSTTPSATVEIVETSGAQTLRVELSWPLISFRNTTEPTEPGTLDILDGHDGQSMVSRDLCLGMWYIVWRSDTLKKSLEIKPLDFT